MKLKLTKDKVIDGKTYPKDAVIDVFEPEWRAWIADGSGVSVPDGTMARMVAYDVPGCNPPQAQQSSEASEPLARAASNDANFQGQKTNTFKK